MPGKVFRVAESIMRRLVVDYGNWVHWQNVMVDGLVQESVVSQLRVVVVVVFTGRHSELAGFNHLVSIWHGRVVSFSYLLVQGSRVHRVVSVVLTVK
jgi:hypothetical protein